MTAKPFRHVILLGILIPWTGCLRPVPAPTPVVVSRPAVNPPVPQKSEMLRHLEGVWESRGANGNQGQMIFSPDGTLIFKGKMEFYNPARWELDEARQELRLTLPEADNNRLQVFQIAVGDGVKAFNPTTKQITYTFNTEIWALQVAGWAYSKSEGADSPARQELEPNQ